VTGRRGGSPPGRGWRGLRLLVAAYTASQVGSAVSLVALPIIIYRLTGSPLQTAILTLIEFLPTLVLGLFAGVLADRVPGRLLPVATDVVSAAAFGGLAMVLTVAHPPVWVVYAAALLASVSFVFHSAPFPRLVRALVGREGVTAASSAFVLGDTLASITGSALAAVLLTVAPMTVAVAFDAATFAVSALLILAVRIPRPSGPPAPAAAAGGGPGRSGWRDEMRTGVRFFWTTRDLRNAMAACTGMVFTGGALLALLTPFVGQGLGASAHGPVIALFYGAGDVGSAVAALMLPALQKRVRVGRIAAWGLACNGVLFALLLAVPTWQAALPVMALWQLTYTLVIVNNGAIRQLLTPVHLLGRVGATARIVAWSGPPLGAAVASTLSAHLSVRAGLACCGVGVALGLAWALAGRVTAIDVRDAPADQAGADQAAPAAGTGPGASAVPATASGGG
jgi:hypothetical protein